MSQRRPFGVRLRWAVPAAAVIASGAVLAGTMLASAAAPALPRQTPAQLLAAMRQAKLPGAMTATVTESANLGFPALPDIGGLSSSSPLSAASLVSGTHTIQIWYSGPRQVRIALPVAFGETDLRVNNGQVWLWDSRGQTATHFLPSPGSRHLRYAAGRSDNPAARSQSQRATPPLTPLQAARRLLALIGPTTRVTVAGTTVVAGRDAYQLAVAPRSSQSLVGRIVIAVDAKTHLPLSVQVFARGSSAPAFGLGFTSLSFGRPAASNFRFTPPPGAHVKTERFPVTGPGVMPGMGPAGGGWSGVPPVGAGRGPQAGAHAIGAGWLTVAAIPAGPLMAFAATKAGPGRRVVLRPKSHASGAYSSSLTVSGPAGVGPGLLGLLLKAAKPVHGSWGSGRLLRTSLISVLLTSKGQLLVGAVTPAVLFADAAKVK
jgi:outer membrane lipoprotein-sorting protein